MFKRLLFTLILALLTLPLCVASTVKPDEVITFKTTPQRDLVLHVFYPNDQKKGENRAVSISFFGGGWMGGQLKQFYEHSEYLASIGMVAITAEYRVTKADKTTPFESAMDAKSAVRWVRKNYKELGVDPEKIVTMGGSAGGHLAVCCAIIDDFEDADDKNINISSTPNAMILYNPVTNTLLNGASRLGGRELELSPLHHIRPDLPPTLVMHGTQDTTVKYHTAVEFVKQMQKAGNQCTLISGFGENHGCFNSQPFRPRLGHRNYDRCMHESTKFLAELGFISEDLIYPEAEPLRIACLGNSITYGSGISTREVDSYPAQLQLLVGEDYEVKNFGKPGATLLSKGNLPYIETEEYKALLEYTPDVVIIKLGTNDSKPMNWQYKDEFEADFDNLIKELQEISYRKPEIIICSPVPSFMPINDTRINGPTVEKEIYPLVKKIAEKNKLVFIDAFQAFKNMRALMPDNIHPNAAGAKRLAKIIHGSIAGTLPAVESYDPEEMVELTDDILPCAPYHTMRGGLKNSQAIFRDKKEGTIAFLGGSITANPGWRDMVHGYFERKFPDTKFTFVDVGIPSEGTTSGSFRFKRDVLSKGKVDLLFEEAAVNDRSEELRCDSDDRVRGMEGIVRQARISNPEMDIVIMNFVDPFKMDDYNNGITPQEILDFKRIADHYDIPTINLAKEVTDRINNGEFTWESDFINLHPSTFGQKVYYRTMYHFLESAYAESKDICETTEYELPDIVDKFAYDNGVYVNISEAKLGKGWSFDPSWEPKNDEKYRQGYVDIPVPAIIAEGESRDLILKFKGRAVGIMVMSGPDAGTLDYTIDGKSYPALDLFTSNSPQQHLARYFMMDNELDGDKTHTLKVRLAPTANEKSKGNACRAISFIVNK